MQPSVQSTLARIEIGHILCLFRIAAFQFWPERP
jgi:hypothetical protein